VDDKLLVSSEFRHDPGRLDHEGAAWFAVEEDIDGTDCIEIVDELIFDGAVEEAEGSHALADPFLRLVSAVEQAAVSFGARPETEVLLRALLGVARMEGASADGPTMTALLAGGIVTTSPAGITRTGRFTQQVLAWQDILRDSEGDYSRCGPATLDEWAADLVTRALGVTSGKEAIRRELRKCGVAAFGLVAAA
jgi:hypothetical protein